MEVIWISSADAQKKLAQFSEYRLPGECYMCRPPPASEQVPMDSHNPKEERL